MAKHKSVTIRVAELNAAKKHKTTLIIDGKAAKVAYITQADVRSGGVKRLIATWTKIADQVALVYKGERATYCRKGSVIERTSLVKIARASTTAKPASAKKVASKKVTSKKVASKKKSSGKKPSAYNLFVKAYLKAHPNLGKSGIKEAAAAWRAKNGGKKSVLKKSSAKKPSAKKVSAKKASAKKASPKARKTKTSSAKRGKSKYNLFVKAFLKANPGLGKAGIKKAAAAWRAKNGGKAPTAKKPSTKKAAVAKKPSKKTSGARKASPYNNFVKAYLKAHPGLGKDGMKAAAAAWRAKNGGKVSTKKPTKKTTKKAVAKTSKKKAAPKASKKHAAGRGVLPNPADILGKAAMKKAGKHC